MNLSDCRSAYQDLSAKASEVARNLAFAGIAIIWIFRIEQGTEIGIPQDLIPATILLLLTLGADLLHYLAGSVIWSIYHRLKERSGTAENEEFTAPPLLNWPSLFFYYAKIASLASAYALLLNYLCRRCACPP